MFQGWYQVAFERELMSPLNQVWIGDLPLVLVRYEGSVRAFQGACPHRGANLGLGQFEGGEIICPFHGYRIGLGRGGERAFSVLEYTTLVQGGNIFVLLSERHENGLAQLLRVLDATHYFVSGFTLQVRAPAEMVIENAFDRRHFQAVHGLGCDLGLALMTPQPGVLGVQGRLVTAANAWQKELVGNGPCETGFFARVFSPNICLTELTILGHSYYVVTAATPGPADRCTIRVSVAAPAGGDGKAPRPELFHALLRDSRTAFEQDTGVWESVWRRAVPSYTSEDDLVLAFHRYCAAFRADGRPQRDDQGGAVMPTHSCFQPSTAPCTAAATRHTEAPEGEGP